MEPPWPGSRLLFQAYFRKKLIPYAIPYLYTRLQENGLHETLRSSPSFSPFYAFSPSQQPESSLRNVRSRPCSAENTQNKIRCHHGDVQTSRDLVPRLCLASCPVIHLLQRLSHWVTCAPQTCPVCFLCRLFPLPLPGWGALATEICMVPLSLPLDFHLSEGFLPPPHLLERTLPCHSPPVILP